MRPNLASLLDLSTGHLALQTRERLADGALCESLGITRRPHGWFVAAHDEIETDEGLPPDMLHCLRYARENGAGWVLFDADADRQEGLPWYGESNTPDLTDTGLGISQIVMDGDVAYVNPAHVESESLKVERTWTQDIGDGDFELAERAAWIGVGPASIRIRLDDEGAVNITVFTRGEEMEAPIHETCLPQDWFTRDAEPEAG